MGARRIVPIFLLLLATGCAKPIIVNTFAGPERPDTDVATLELDFRARLVHLDGRSVAGIPAGLHEHEPHNPRILRLLPGEHEMLVGMRPYVQVHNMPMYSYVPGGGDCKNGGGGGSWIVTGYYTTTSHHAGSRDDEHVAFTVAPGRRYRVRVTEHFGWFSRGRRWSASVVEDVEGWGRDAVVSTSHGRQRHAQPTMLLEARTARADVKSAERADVHVPSGGGGGGGGDDAIR